MFLVASGADVIIAWWRSGVRFQRMWTNARFQNMDSKSAKLCWECLVQVLWLWNQST